MHLSSTTQLIPPQSLKLSTGFRSKNIFVFPCNLIRYFAHYARKKEFNVTWKFSHTQKRSFFTTEVGILFPRPWQFWDFLLTHNGQKMCETLAELIWSSRAQSFFPPKNKKGCLCLATALFLLLLLTLYLGLIIWSESTFMKKKKNSLTLHSF